MLTGGAIALVCFLATMPDGLDRMLDSVAANTRIVVHLEQAAAARGWHLDSAGTIWLRVDDPERVGPLMHEIDDTFHNSEAQTASEPKRASSRATTRRSRA